MPIVDVPDAWPVRSTRLAYRGRVFDLRADEVDGPTGTMVREYLDHPGAVGIVALDDDDRVLLQRQYRHPVRRRLWEVPAGLLDVAGEDPLAAARRELAEEADLQAGTWHSLVDYFTTPGGSNEAIRVFLARDLTPAAERFDRSDEEADMVTEWLPLAEAVDAALAGNLHNPTTVVGVLAAATARSAGWAPLRAPDAPWPGRRGA